MKAPSIAALVLLMPPVAAYAQPIAEKPAIAVGDSWVFSRTSSDGKSGTWSRTVIEAPSADRLRVRFENDTVADYDAVLNFMPDGNPEYARILVKYPLKVGAEWPMARRFPNPGTAETGNAKVVAYESISVPAGTFQCYRVEAEASLVNRNFKENRVWKRWYCPDVKWIAREVLETMTGGTAGRLGGTISETSELVKFTPAR